MLYCHLLFMVVVDFISDVAMARRGYPRAGISACYGGPLFSILACTLTLSAVLIVPCSVVHRIQH